MHLLQLPDDRSQIRSQASGFTPLQGTLPADQHLPLPLTHLDRVDGVVGSDLLHGLAATDHLHGDPGLELGTVGAALAHGGSPLSGVVPRLKG